ncbi:MAG: hypothetical protein KF708_18180 [Pirellulales bacterium]|nr:hypothetical protein [Pirellulales bacterium]
MSTKPSSNTAAAVERRIRRFFDLLNDEQFEKCYQMIDPRIRDRATSVTLLQYIDSAKRFREKSGRLDLLSVDVESHENEPSPLYEDRDFSIGKSVCHVRSGKTIEFQERWVREGRSWYTRATGFVTTD